MRNKITVLLVIMLCITVQSFSASSMPTQKVDAFLSDFSVEYEGNYSKMPVAIIDAKVYIDQDEILEMLGLESSFSGNVLRIQRTAKSSSVDQIEYNSGIYTGDIEYGRPNGSGTWHHPDGQSYVGDWINGQFHGSGRLVRVNGDVYEGDFEYGFMHGSGSIYYQNGDKYDGEFDYSQIEGKGTMWYDNGHRYVGYWKDGLYHGYGSLYEDRVSPRSGEWKNGEYIKYMSDPDN